MGLGLIRSESKFARPLLVVAAIVCVVFTWYSSRWYFANGVSNRVEIKELADLMVDIAPSDPQTHFAAAVLYDKTFDPADARRALAEYENAAVLTPHNYLSWLELGKARERSGDAAGAEKAFLRATELAPNYADVQWAYGNFLLRSGRSDDGFARIRRAASSRPEYLSAAAVTAMTILDGDIERVRGALGDSPPVNAALSTFLLGQAREADAATAWDRIPADEKRTTYKQNGETLLSQLAGKHQFRLASRVAAGVFGDNGRPQATGQIANGGFESEIKINDTRLFNWQFGNGSSPQINLSDSPKHLGSLSLFLNFNTMQAADMRQIAQTIAVDPGTSFSFEAWYRSDLKGSVAWEIVDACENKPMVRTPAIGSSTDWVRASADFTVPLSCDGVTVRLVRDGCISSVCPISGKLWFDDISLSRK